MKTMTNLGQCYEKFVKEFIVNITEDCSEGSEEFGQVYMRGRCVKFSPADYGLASAPVCRRVIIHTLGV
jgi:hypothetical protein